MQPVDRFDLETFMVSRAVRFRIMRLEQRTDAAKAKAAKADFANENSESMNSYITNSQSGHRNGHLKNGWVALPKRQSVAPLPDEILDFSPSIIFFPDVDFGFDHQFELDPDHSSKGETPYLNDTHGL